MAIIILLLGIGAIFFISSDRESENAKQAVTHAQGAAHAVSAFVFSLLATLFILGGGLLLIASYGRVLLPPGY